MSVVNISLKENAYRIVIGHNILAKLVLAAMCLRAQWKLIEVHRLAREMAGIGSIGSGQGMP